MKSRGEFTEDHQTLSFGSVANSTIVAILIVFWALQAYSRRVTALRFRRTAYSQGHRGIPPGRSQGRDHGDFASLVQQGLPEERADHFIDPWDTAYWVRDRCNEDTGERVVFVYSMGPNRRRDSSRWRIRGDDIGAYVIGGPEQSASRNERDELRIRRKEIRIPGEEIRMNRQELRTNRQELRISKELAGAHTESAGPPPVSYLGRAL